MSLAKHRQLPCGALAIIAAMALMTIISPAATAASGDPWTDIPEDEVIDYGKFWGTTLFFGYQPPAGEENQAQTIEWDMGDGSPRRTDWQFQHSYARPGVYIVVQHVTNTYEGFSEDWGYFRVEYMGQPYVEVVTPEGAPDMGRIYIGNIHVAPERPSDPVWTGHDFIGYYQDPEHTVPFDWDALVTEPVTAYAAFKGASVVDPTDPDPVDPDPTDPGDEDATAGIVEQYGALIIGIAGGISIAAFAVYRYPVALIVGIGLLVIAVLLHLGVI